MVSLTHDTKDVGVSAQQHMKMEKTKITVVQAMFEVAKGNDEVNHYKKFKKVDARPAIEGEIIVTIVNDEKETQSTAKKGDFVVRAKGNNKEQYVVEGAKFKKRYNDAGKEQDADGFREYDPIGECFAFKYHGDSFTFVAPWGEDMLVNDEDYIASIDIDNLNDIYRIEKDEFVNTYKAVKND